MRKVFPLFILISVLLVSCKDKSMDILFTWDGEFTHDFLVAIIETPPENFQPDSAMPGNTTVEEFDFFGVSMDEMRELLLQFGDCNLHVQVNFIVELNGLNITKIYIPEGAKLFFDFESENVLPKIVHTTSDVVMEQYPDHRLDFAKDDKSFNFYCCYPKSFLIYEKTDSSEDMDLSQMGKSKQEGVKIRLKDNKVIMTYKDKKTPTNMTMTIERIKGK